MSLNEIFDSHAMNDKRSVELMIILEKEKKKEYQYDMIVEYISIDVTRSK